MPKPILLRSLLKNLQRYGFVFISQKGSHAKFAKGQFTTIVPMHGKEIPHGTFRSILRQTNLTEENLKK
ncbi:type II toxin-antitoxin system HicA family toxin [Patescibacteria group bacterium]|nr:type II toxin-antitoxin system HicA family toxin [Patescibacteria group bacterium]